MITNLRSSRLKMFFGRIFDFCKSVFYFFHRSTKKSVVASFFIVLKAKTNGFRNQKKPFVRIAYAILQRVTSWILRLIGLEEVRSPRLAGVSQNYGRLYFQQISFSLPKFFQTNFELFCAYQSILEETCKQCLVLSQASNPLLNS